MDKATVYKNVAKRIDGCTKADVQTVLDVFSDVVKEAFANGEEMVIVPNLGKFKVKHHNEKKGISNLTGKAFAKEAWDELVFVAAPNAKKI